MADTIYEIIANLFDEMPLIDLLGIESLAWGQTMPNLFLKPSLLGIQRSYDLWLSQHIEE